MLVHGFDMYRVFISAPGDLVREHDACRIAIGEVNEQEAMPKKILLVTVGLREDSQIVGFRSAIAGNIRQCTYFIQLFEDDWGPERLLRKMFFAATECLGDDALPMREIIVCLKDAPHETDPAVLAFRKELEDTSGVRILRFDKPERLKEQVIEVCSQWVESISTALPPESHSRAASDRA